MMRGRRDRNRYRNRRKFNPRTELRAGRRKGQDERVLGKGAIAGLVMIAAVFIGGLAMAYLWIDPPEPKATPVSWAGDNEPRAQGPRPEFDASQEPGVSSQDVAAVDAQFDHCGMVRRTCVVDGDTFWLNGEKIRIADIDTPEISQPQCAYEKQLGLQATDRLIGLLNAGPFELHTIGARDTDQYGRMLRVVVRDGKSLGDQLVSEGLARTWTGRREPWC